MLRLNFTPFGFDHQVSLHEQDRQSEYKVKAVITGNSEKLIFMKKKLKIKEK